MALWGIVPPVLAQEEKNDSPIFIVTAADDDHIFAPLNNTNDSLYDVLALAYANNPTARAARAELLVVLEQLPQAQAGFKPTITAEADVTHTDTETKGQSFISSDGSNLSKSTSLNLNQPLFRGGRTYAGISAVKNIITAQELTLSATEQAVLYDAAVSYMNVLQDGAILKLNSQNRDLVARQKEQAENRFSVGELTRTDVSQAAARLAEADADVITANGGLKRSLAVYRQIIGSPPPRDMAYPKTILQLPATLEEALSLADSNNRDVLISKFVKAAAKDDVRNRYGVFLPEVSAIGRLNKNYDASDFIDEQRQTSIGITASIPLYKAGTNLSKVREAKKTENQRAIQIIEAQEKARQETISNWESLQTAQAEVKARETQIEASRIAREGVHYELKFGERTTLDALDANQELLNAQVKLITARRDEVVAQFALARSLGVLVPQRLGFSSITP
jgi:TolC family type I secretion outer membrane protein